LVEIAHAKHPSRARSRALTPLVAGGAYFYEPPRSARESARRRLATTRDAVVVGRTIWIAGLPTWRRATRASARARRRTISRGSHAPHADLARIAGVEARLDGRTRMTRGRVAEVRAITRAFALLG